VLKNYVEDINNGFAVRLLADYNSFKRNKPKYLIDPYSLINFLGAKLSYDAKDNGYGRVI
ncbi:hypothetical protein CR513_55834, partial [Mucuna pruriens]